MEISSERTGEEPAVTTTPHVVVAPETLTTPAPVLLAPVPFYKNTQIMVAIIVAALLLLGAGYYLYTSKYMNGGVVAVVNGHAIYKKEFDESVSLIEQSAVLQGIDLATPEAQNEIKAQALETLISNALLLTAAKDSGFEVKNEEIESKYSELATQLGGTDELTTRMAAVGLTEEKLRSNIMERILADQYIEAQTAIEELTVSDEEVAEFYAEISSANPDIPELTEVTDQIKDQLLGQKQQQIVLDLITKLRDEATIDIKI